MPGIIQLPEPHSGQRLIWEGRTDRNVVRCGRRWGKTIMLQIIAANCGAKGGGVGIFTPESKQWAEVYDGLEDILEPIKKSSDRTKGKYRTNRTIRPDGMARTGKLDFWATNDNFLAGRGREYDTVLIDEAGFTKNGQFKGIWEKSIQPTMLTTCGSAWVFSTPFGNDPNNWFWEICNDKSKGWKEFYAPTSSNPYVPPDELERYKRENHPMVFQQEYLAEFVDWSGDVFFARDKLLIDGEPIDYPEKCDGVYAVIDTAVKGGKEHDGTAVIYVAFNKYYGQPLTILDYDVVQIDGAMLEHWMPSVMSRLDQLAMGCGARHGNVGAFIEDAAAGSILIQQGRNRGWKTHAIDSKLTSLGKDERAISVSGYFWQEKIKVSKFAYAKEIQFKGVSKNHLLSQISQFRIGDKLASTRADDLLDTFVYSIAIGVGDKYGI